MRVYESIKCHFSVWQQILIRFPSCLYHILIPNYDTFLGYELWPSRRNKLFCIRSRLIWKQLWSPILVYICNVALNLYCNKILTNITKSFSLCIIHLQSNSGDKTKTKIHTVLFLCTWLWIYMREKERERESPYKIINGFHDFIQYTCGRTLNNNWKHIWFEILNTTNTEFKKSNDWKNSKPSIISQYFTHSNYWLDAKSGSSQSAAMFTPPLYKREQPF